MNIKRRILNGLVAIYRLAFMPARIKRLALSLALRVAPIGGAADSSNSQIGSRTTLHFWSTSISPAVYTKIGQISHFGPLGKDRQEVDTTDLDSTGVERIGALPDGREMTISVFANTITLPQMEALFDANATIYFKATFPAPLSLSRYFALAPLGITQGGEVAPNDPLMVELRGRISGNVSSTDTLHP